MRNALIVGVGALWVVSLGYLAFGEPEPVQAQTPISVTLPACENEDGSGGPIPCRWDAGESGNGEGLSFTIVAPNVYVYDSGRVEVVNPDTGLVTSVVTE